MRQKKFGTRYGQILASALMFCGCSTSKPKPKVEATPTPEPTTRPAPVLTELGVWYTGELSKNPEILSLKEYHSVRESSYTIQLLCTDPVEKRSSLIDTTTSLKITSDKFTIGEIDEKSDSLGSSGNVVPCKIAASPPREVLFKYNPSSDQLSYVDEKGTVLQSFKRSDN